MFRRVSKNLTFFTFTSDVALTLAALYLAKVLRLALPYGIDTAPPFLKFPPALFGIVAVIWIIVFLVIPVYDSCRTYRAIWGSGTRRGIM